MRKLGGSSLRDVMHFCEHSRCIREDEPFFNVLLRFACGVESVAVVADTAEHPNSLLLGTFTMQSLLEWVEEDLTLFSASRHPLKTVSVFRSRVH